MGFIVLERVWLIVGCFERDVWFIIFFISLNLIEPLMFIFFVIRILLFCNCNFDIFETGFKQRIVLHNYSF